MQYTLLDLQYTLLDLPGEILKEILKELSVKELIKFEIVNTIFKEFIRVNNWDHLIVTLENLDNIRHVIKTYKFKKYNFSYSDIGDADVCLLKDCDYLILAHCTRITDKSVKLLGNCHKLSLSGCQITDASVALLGNVHTLYLSECTQITDASVSLLGNCHALYLSECIQITDASVVLLAKCHTLHLSCCFKITDNSVKMLTKCHNLNLAHCRVTNKSVELLKCQTVNLNNCFGITHHSVKILRDAHCNVYYNGYYPIYR